MSSLPTNAVSGVSGLRTALVLDDEAQVGTVICSVAAACGYAVRQFTEAVAFFAEVNTSTPALIVLDLALGQTDAVEVIRHLETIKYGGDVLLVSGHDEATLADVSRIGRRHGLAMLPPLRKPFRTHELKSRLAACPHGQRPRAPQDIVAGAPPDERGGNGLVDLGEALRSDWLRLWYQPKIDLKSLAVCGAEALLRAVHPDLGILRPADILPPPGDPLYRPLSEFVIGRALADWRYFAEQNLRLKLAVNVPVSVIAAPDFIGMVRQMLPNDRDFPGLIIELTEDETIRDPDRVREIATQLKLYDVSVSIDDFGSGYASLSRLNDLPFVEVKIDRCFVANCASDQLRRALCQTTIDVAHRFGASACAEGVETAEDLRSLIDMGCDVAQGFLFARPMASTKLATALLARSSA